MKKSFTVLICMLICSMGARSQTPAKSKTSAKPKPAFFKVTQRGIFEWGADCYYDPTKYSKEVLMNADRMGTAFDGLSVYFDFGFIVDPVGDTNEEHYAYMRNYIATCKLPAGLFWENLRKETLKKYDFEKELDDLDLEFKNNPSAYKDSKYAKYCPEVAEILAEGGTRMFDEWKKLIKKQAQNNAEPERILKEFQEKADSKDWGIHARRDLVNYIWKSCMVDFKNGGTIYNKISQRSIYDAYKKLFIKVEEDDY